AKAISAAAEQNNSHRAAGIKPVGLIKMWREQKRHRRAGFVPNVIVVAGNDTKLVITRFEARVKGRTPRAGVDPIRVVTFQPVFEMDFCRGAKTERGVMNFQIAATGRNGDG